MFEIFGYIALDHHNPLSVSFCCESMRVSWESPWRKIVSHTRGSEIVLIECELLDDPKGANLWWTTYHRLCNDEAWYPYELFEHAYSLSFGH